MQVQFFVGTGNKDAEVFLENFQDGLDFYELVGAEDSPFDSLEYLTSTITDGIDNFKITEGEIEEDIIFSFLDSIFGRRRHISQWGVL